MSPRIRIVLFQEEGDWVAQCLEHDVCSQGGSAPEALMSLARVLATHIKLDEDEGVEPLSRVPSAPEELWTRKKPS